MNHKNNSEKWFCIEVPSECDKPQPMLRNNAYRDKQQILGSLQMHFIIQAIWNINLRVLV